MKSLPCLLLQPGAVWTAHSSFVGPDEEAARKTSSSARKKLLGRFSKEERVVRTTHMAQHQNAAPMNSIKLFHVRAAGLHGACYDDAVEADSATIACCYHAQWVGSTPDAAAAETRAISACRLAIHRATSYSLVTPSIRRVMQQQQQQQLAMHPCNTSTTMSAAHMHDLQPETGCLHYYCDMRPATAYHFRSVWISPCNGLLTRPLMQPCCPCTPAEAAQLDG
jgi:hypothetical protein